MKPGIYNDMSIDDYHSGPGLSASGIKLILDAPKKYWNRYINQSVEKKTDSNDLIIGSATHTAVLEPHLFDKRYAVAKKINKRSDKGKEEFENFKEANKGKQVLDVKDYDFVMQLAHSVRNNKIFMEVMSSSKEANIENSIFWEDTISGQLLKSRPDFFNENIIVDLKTSCNASPYKFQKQIFDLGYHIQAAMAIDALNASGHKKYSSFLFMVVEKKEPYLTATYLLDPKAIEVGRNLYMNAVDIYQDCVRNESWNGYIEDIALINLPKWAYEGERI